MIEGCLHFVGADRWGESETFEGLRHIGSGVAGRKIFGKGLARLLESRFQKGFEPVVVKGAVLDDPEDRRHHFGGGHERFGGYVEKPPHLSAALRQHGKGGKGLLPGQGSELFGHLFLHHHQKTPAMGVFERPQDDVRRDVIGEIGNQMVRPVFQTLAVPVTQNISAYEFQPSILYGSREPPAQMFTKVSVHLVSGDILFLDQEPGQIT